MALLYRDDERRRRLGEAARARVGERYTLEHMVAGTVEVYEIARRAARRFALAAPGGGRENAGVDLAAEALDDPLGGPSVPQLRDPRRPPRRLEHARAPPRRSAPDRCRSRGSCPT